MKKTILSFATFASTMIGVGFFSLPYLASRLGFWTMVVYLFAMAAIAIIIHLIFSRLVLKAPDYSRFPGFVGFYLGKNWKKIGFLTSTIGMLGAMLAYLIIGGEFLANIFSPVFGGSYTIYILIYFFIGAALIFSGIRIVEKIELWGLVLFIVALVFIFIKGLPVFDVSNLFMVHSQSFNVHNLFLAFGPILFSFWGISVVPEMEEQLKDNKQQLKKVIPAGILTALVVYLVFIIVVYGICGRYVTPDALSGLKMFLTRDALIVGFLFGIIATFTSFISIGLTLKKIFKYDLKIPEILSWFIACFVPLAFFFIGFKNFIQVIGFVGGIVLSLDGILICLMYQRLRRTKKAKTLTSILALVFILAIICEIKYFLIK
ncbi:MAG: aromatic amino acid transport family protein [Candidatus Paceibacterota bacterium]|jgi:amino acid permease